jgi:hypothetical protein
MKSARNILFSALLTIGAFATITYTACKKDECKDVVCQNGGTCDGGNCVCASGYEGTNCETATASKLAGAYSATESCQPPLTGSSNWSSTVTQSSSDKTKIVIANFGDSGANVTGKVDKNAITLDATTIDGTNVTGTGTVNGNILTINYTLTGTVNYSCTMTMTRQ